MPIAVVTILAGLFSAGATAVFGVVRSNRSARRIETERQDNIAAFLDGLPSVPGVTTGALSAAMRMSKVEQGLSDVAQGQSLLEKRMDEANGTGQRTEQMVREIRTHLGLTTA